MVLIRILYTKLGLKSTIVFIVEDERRIVFTVLGLYRGGFREDLEGNMGRIM